MHVDHMSWMIFKFNWDFTLILFRNFHVIKWIFTNNWDFTLLKVFTLTKINQDFNLIN